MGSMRAMCQLLVAAAAGAALAAASPAAPEASSACQVRVTTTPAGAVITCDGVLRDAAPLVLGDLQPGEHLLVAAKDGYSDARQTITLTQPAQRIAVDLKLEPIMGLVLVTSEPPGAAVQIDGASRGETPLLITDLPLGRYRMRMTLASCRDQEVELNIDSRTPHKETVIMNSSSATLELDSQPTGAKVVLNGADRGTTPCTLDSIPEGENKLSLTLDGCEPFEQSVRMRAGEKQKLSAVLKQIPAKLTLVSIPAGARMYVNNQFKGEAPVSLSGLEPGEYRLRAELAAHEPVSRTITVTRAADTTEEFRMEPNCGTIEISTAPAGVTVRLDGKVIGKTAAKAGETDRVSDAMRIETVPIGPHRLQFTLKGYATREENIAVERDKTAIVQAPLTRLFIPDCEVQTGNGFVRGVLVEVDPQGNVKLEVKPGIIKTIPAGEILSRRVIRGEGVQP